MSKKAFKKKKDFQRMCADQHAKGLLNDANGNWVGSNAIRASIWQMSMSGNQHRKM